MNQYISREQITWYKLSPGDATEYSFAIMFFRNSSPEVAGEDEYGPIPVPYMYPGVTRDGYVRIIFNMASARGVADVMLESLEDLRYLPTSYVAGKLGERASDYTVQIILAAASSLVQQPSNIQFALDAMRLVAGIRKR